MAREPAAGHLHHGGCKEEEAGLNDVVSDIRRWMATDVHLPAGYRWEMAATTSSAGVVQSLTDGLMVVGGLLVYMHAGVPVHSRVTAAA